MNVLELLDDDGEPAALHNYGGDGPHLLLTHGNGLNAGMWATTLPVLQQRFHCWALDFRGHGASRPRQASFSVDRGRFVNEVLAAVHAMGGAPVLAAGHSLGGATLLRTEEQHRGTFAALWAFEPVIIPADWAEPPAPSVLIEASRRRRMEFASVEEALERFTAKPPFSRCQPEAVRAYIEIGSYPLAGGGIRLSCEGETEARIYESNERKDLSQLGGLTCPIMVGAGGAMAAGNDLPPRVAPLIASALGNGALEVFEDLTHFAPMEDGDRVAKAIIAHLLPHARR